MHEEFASNDTIVAIATASGYGGVGVVRLSGPDVRSICEAIVGTLPNPRQAHYSAFKDEHSSPIDLGLCLYFEAPHSFTGEHVLELQGHGGPIVLDQVVRRCLQLGARMARPGEFSERAFLNGKLDLAQAEAVADLISASTHHAAKSAVQSLKGEFSNKIKALNLDLVAIRTFVEAAIDFPDEEVEFLKHGDIHKKTNQLMQQLISLLASAKQGVLLKEGLKVAIIGEPNVGKSSLLNALCEQDIAIVSSTPGTTRDLVKEHINLDGVPIEVIDTAGIRDGGDLIEEEGMQRAQRRLDSIDKILWVSDSREKLVPSRLKDMIEAFPEKVISIVNKIDQTTDLPGERLGKLFVSAKTGAGLECLKQRLKQEVGANLHEEGTFIARRRHVSAIEAAKSHIDAALSLLEQGHSSECVAEELRLSHRALCEITGEFTSDDLLGKIFSEFCIGK